MNNDNTQSQEDAKYWETYKKARQMMMVHAEMGVTISLEKAIEALEF